MQSGIARGLVDAADFDRTAVNRRCWDTIAIR